MASRLFNRAIQALLGLPFGDTQCGLKGFRRQTVLELFGRARLDGFAFDEERARPCSMRLTLALPVSMPGPAC